MDPRIRSTSSTYRLQLNHGMTFEDARELVSYLYELGIDTLYVSPILQARAGSMHGYDVIDHGKLNPELGGAEALERLVARLREFGMGLMVDIVPNHMCVSDLADWRWRDVLENGPSSPDARFFDVDWNPPRQDMRDKVLLPRLGDQYGRVLENRELRIEFTGGAFNVRYWETAFPLAPRSWIQVLTPAVERVRAALGRYAPAVLELESIITALGYLPRRTELGEERVHERRREREIIRRRLLALTEAAPEVARSIAAALDQINGERGVPESFDALEKLLADQAYRLSYWRVAADEVNYRRFFDINELAAIRTEDPAVFEETHRLIFELIGKGWITALRVDHPDGLFDPAGYFQQLQVESPLPDPAATGRRLYVVAEKIVSGDEELRENWQVEGTTGYGFLNQLNGLFVYSNNHAAFRRGYERLTGWRRPLEELIYDSKRLILQASMSSELNVLARRLDRICQQHRHTRDFTLETLRFALSEIIACFPVYRTYITAEQKEPDPEDRRHIESAVMAAISRNPAINESVFDAIGSLLMLEDPDGTSAALKAERRLFVMRLQQLTSPVMAKGVEDTAFYRYYPLASLNEVGGDPARFGVTPRAFHRANEIRLKRWPREMLCSSTHDTKRSEDVRARINVLSEIPEPWFAAVNRWIAMNAGKHAVVDRQPTPDANAGYLIYQTLAGVWPFTALSGEQRSEFVNRMTGYLEKAMKEAKLHTSWVNPDARYDRAVRGFIEAILEPAPDNAFPDDFQAFVAPVIRAGMLNSLSQVLLKGLSPGVPDFYQGCESWNFSLVDPDNRRPVDFVKLQKEMESLKPRISEARAELVGELLRTAEDGRIKLFLTCCTLRYRRANRALFETGAYTALEPIGSRRAHLVGFARRWERSVMIAAAGRFFLKLDPSGALPLPTGVWEDTALPLPKQAQASSYHNVLTGESMRAVEHAGRLVLPAGELFRTGLPVALLEAQGQAED